MADPVRVIVVDDEPDLREMIATYLGKYGFIVSGAADGPELDAHLASGSPDLLILDVNLPGEDGFAIARRIRARSTVPILMLTAAGDTVDRVVGLELGADDYVAKPFQIEEVLARIRALLRRSVGHAKSEFLCGPVRLDSRTGRVSVDGTPVKLTSHEYRLLSYLMHHTGRVVSRTELVEHLYDQDFDRDSNTIEVFVGRIRKKLGVEIIQTVRGLGYLLTPPADAR